MAFGILPTFCCEVAFLANDWYDLAWLGRGTFVLLTKVLYCNKRGVF